MTVHKISKYCNMNMARMPAMTVLLLIAAIPFQVWAEPHSRPYIPFRTDPTNHPFVKHRITWDDERSDRRRSRVTQYAAADDTAKQRCPLQFTLGVSRRAHHKAQNSNAFSIVRPPVIHSVFPGNLKSLFVDVMMLTVSVSLDDEQSSSRTGSAGCAHYTV